METTLRAKVQLQFAKPVSTVALTTDMSIWELLVSATSPKAFGRRSLLLALMGFPMPLGPFGSSAKSTSSARCCSPASAVLTHRCDEFDQAMASHLFRHYVATATPRLEGFLHEVCLVFLLRCISPLLSVVGGVFAQPFMLRSISIILLWL